MAGVDHLAVELEFTARRLRQAAAEDLRKELQDAVTAATRPVPEAIRAGLVPRLPDPYAEVLDKALRITVSKRYGARDPGVAIKATTTQGGRRRLRRLETGVLEHPLFGNRERWYKQAVGPGWFSEPVAQAAAGVREEITQAMDRVAAFVTRKG